MARCVRCMVIGVTAATRLDNNTILGAGTVNQVA
jgi:hypothetical protein